MDYKYDYPRTYHACLLCVHDSDKSPWGKLTWGFKKNLIISLLQEMSGDTLCDILILTKPIFKSMVTFLKKETLTASLDLKNIMLDEFFEDLTPYLKSLYESALEDCEDHLSGPSHEEIENLLINSKEAHCLNEETRKSRSEYFDHIIQEIHL